ncbi:HAD family phosphatase [Hydrotalea sp.]|uniref:HAD family hydrolase n=1 Tax=Hydrotalea sp. TaxID=2881279 RepID=UPI002605AFE0|nr:HAD family phosphatase [Hydrotalea sp.]
MNGVKNIIFDLGGIFINLDFQKTTEAFQQLGVTQLNNFFTQTHSNSLFAALETGTITTHEFYDAFRKQTGIVATNEAIALAWNAMLVNFPSDRINWLNAIKDKYNIFLYSNTNQIHYDCFIEMFQSDTGNNNFNHYFKKAYYSHEIRMRKPDADGFQFILEEQNLVPEETLFIDDTLPNIETAHSLGLQIIHLKAPLTVLDLHL